MRALLGGAAGLVSPIRRRQRGGPAPITAAELTDAFVAFTGNGGNVGLVIGPDSLVMMDVGGSGSS